MTDKTDEPKLTPAQRKAAKLWADRIIADHRAHARGAPKKYPAPPEWIREKGEGHLLELPTVAGKPMGACTFLEVRIMGEAYQIAAQHYKAVEAARDLLVSEMTA